MSIDGEHLPIARKQQRASNSLRPNTLEAREKLFGLFQRSSFQKRQIKRLTPLEDFIQQLLDPHRLLLRQPTGFNCSLDRRSSRPPGLIPCRKLPFQVFKRAIAINVGGRLREYSFDEHIKRIEPLFELGSP